MSLIQLNSVLKVVYNKNEDGSEEVDGKYYRKRKIELRSRDGYPMEYHDRVALQKIYEVYFVFEVQGHVVVTGNQIIQPY